MISRSLTFDTPRNSYNDTVPNSSTKSNISNSSFVHPQTQLRFEKHKIKITVTPIFRNIVSLACEECPCYLQPMEYNTYNISSIYERCRKWAEQMKVKNLITD
jgi:hypothetical protein